MYVAVLSCSHAQSPESIERSRTSGRKSNPQYGPLFYYWVTLLPRYEVCANSSTPTSEPRGSTATLHPRPNARQATRTTSPYLQDSVSKAESFETVLGTVKQPRASSFRIGGPLKCCPFHKKPLLITGRK